MNLDDLLTNALKELAAVKNAVELEAFRIKYLGTKGLLKDASDHLRTLPGPEKKGYGQRMNEVKGTISTTYEEKKIAIESAGGPKVVTGIDITEPGRLKFDAYEPGHLHIITQTINELTALFARMGFTFRRAPTLAVSPLSPDRACAMSRRRTFMQGCPLWFSQPICPRVPANTRQSLRPWVFRPRIQ